MAGVEDRLGCSTLLATLDEAANEHSSALFQVDETQCNTVDFAIAGVPDDNCLAADRSRYTGKAERDLDNLVGRWTVSSAHEHPSFGEVGNLAITRHFST